MFLCISIYLCSSAKDGYLRLFFRVIWFSDYYCIALLIGVYPGYFLTVLVLLMFMMQSQLLIPLRLKCLFLISLLIEPCSTQQIPAWICWSNAASSAVITVPDFYVVIYVAMFTNQMAIHRFMPNILTKYLCGLTVWLELTVFPKYDCVVIM